MSWQREYKQPGKTFMAFFVGGVLLFIGLIFLLLFGWVGALIILAAVAVPAAIIMLGTETTVTCSDQGFIVRKSSRRTGVNEAAYGWYEVTATQYYEPSQLSRDSGPRGRFAVDTARGRAFDVRRCPVNRCRSSTDANRKPAPHMRQGRFSFYCLGSQWSGSQLPLSRRISTIWPM